MLYKYRALGSRTEAIFTSKEVWLATRSTLNDPLDCRIPPLTANEVRAYETFIKQNQLGGFLWQLMEAKREHRPFFTLDDRGIRILSGRIKRAANTAEKYRIAQNYLRKIGAMDFTEPAAALRSIEDQLEQIGVFSLSADPVNTLMWSHYGDSHKGIAIGFSHDAGCKLGDSYLCRQVEYSNTLPNIDVGSGLKNRLEYYVDEAGQMRSRSVISLDDPQVKRALFWKTTAWSYENEWRLVLPQSGLHPLPGSIVEVIFGLNCKAADREHYIELAKATLTSAPAFYQVQQARHSASLVLRSLS